MLFRLVDFLKMTTGSGDAHRENPANKPILDLQNILLKMK